MILRTLAIVLAVMGLCLSALQASAQPQGGGWRQGGGRGAAAGQRWSGGGFRPGGFEGGGRRGFGGGYPGAGYGGAPEGRGYRQPGYGAPGYPPSGASRFGGSGYGGPGYGAPRYGGYPPANGGQMNGAPGYARSWGGYASGRGMDSGWRAEQDQVRQAVREGRHIPLNQAIEAVRRRAPGHELDAGLESGPDGRAVYRLRWAGQGGRRQDYLVDAGTGAVLGAPRGP